MAWFTMPLAVLVLGLVVILVFYPQWKRLIGRFTKIGKIEVLPEIQQSAQEATSPEALPAPVAGGTKLRTDEVLLMHDTPIILQRDRKIREDLERLETPGDRDRILIRLLAGAFIVRDFERVYGQIFGSQIEALAALNSAGDSGMTAEAVLVFYDNAVAHDPVAYTNYTFEQWAGFLRRELLVRDVQNGHAITDWGTEFLVHLARSRRPVFKAL